MTTRAEAAWVLTEGIARASKERFLLEKCIAAARVIARHEIDYMLSHGMTVDDIQAVYRFKDRLRRSVVHCAEFRMQFEGSNVLVKVYDD